MEEDGENLSSPFWIPTSTKRRRSDRIRRGLSSLFLNSGLLILLLLITAVSFLVFVVPSTLSFSAQIFRPSSVKKSWDSLNLVLVLFALVFGFLNRSKSQDSFPNDQYQTSPITRNEYLIDEASKSNPSQSPQKWYDYSDQSNQMAYNNSSSTINTRGGFLRTSSSYPDLSEVSYEMEFRHNPWRFSDDINWATGTGQLLRRRSWKDKSDDANGPRRFYDDIYRASGTGQLLRRGGWKDKSDDATTNTRIDISSRDTDASTPPRPPPALPPSPPSSALTSTVPEEKPKASHGSLSVGQKRERYKRKDIDMMSMEPMSPPVAPPPPPPPPPPPLPQFADPKSGKSHKKRSSGSATRDFLNSLYHKKKKKQRQKSIDNFDSLLHQYQQPSQSPPPPPSPPVPPQISSKKSTRKGKRAVVSASSDTTTSQYVTVAMNPLPKAVKVSNFYDAKESSNSGGESPVINIPPPPPPPPPFSKSLAWKFALQGDYVRVDSTGSSRSVSPEPDDTESDITPMAGDGTPLTVSSLFCPSPDVNTKADNFISKFRAGLKLEKINSMKKKQGLGLSNLGPGLDSN